MKIALVISLLTTAAAFSSPPSAFVRTHTVALKVTAAEQHLETLLEEWNQLESELEVYKDRKDDVRERDTLFLVTILSTIKKLLTPCSPLHHADTVVCCCGSRGGHAHQGTCHRQGQT
jgi:hypothetical protein